MRTALLGLMASFLFAGCTTIEIKPPSLEQQLVLVNNSAKVGTTLAIKAVYKNDLAKQIALAKEIKKYVGIVYGPETGTVDIKAVLNLISQYFPADSALYMDSAVNILLAYVNVDLNQALSENQQKLVKAFFLGVDEGCDRVIGLVF